MAVNTVKKWATGFNHNGSKVSAKTQALAAKALAEWEAKKAKAHVTEAELSADELTRMGEDFARRKVLVEGYLMTLGDKAAGKRAKRNATAGAVQLLEGKSRIDWDDSGADFNETRLRLKEERKVVAFIADALTLSEGPFTSAKEFKERREARTDKTFGGKLKTRGGKNARDPEFEKNHPRAPKGRTGGGEWIMSGSSGRQVKTVQRELGLKGDDLTGKYDDATEQAVRQYQRENGLLVDGIVGAQTAGFMQGNEGIDPGALSASDREFLSSRSGGGEGKATPSGGKKKDDKKEKPSKGRGRAVQEATLTAKGRKQISDGDFALPGRRYPIHDISHARNALARVAQHGSEAEKKRVRAAVHAKYPSLKNDDLQEAKSVKCPKCDYKVSADATKCPNCGHDMSKAKSAVKKKLEEGQPYELLADGLPIIVEARKWAAEHAPEAYVSMRCLEVHVRELSESIPDLHWTPRFHPRSRIGEFVDVPDFLEVDYRANVGSRLSRPTASKKRSIAAAYGVDSLAQTLDAKPGSMMSPARGEMKQVQPGRGILPRMDIAGPEPGSKDQRRAARGYGVGYGTRYEQRRPSTQKKKPPKKDLASAYGIDSAGGPTQSPGKAGALRSPGIKSYTPDRLKELVRAPGTPKELRFAAAEELRRLNSKRETSATHGAGMRSPGLMSKEQRKLARGYGVGYGTRYEQRRPSQQKPAEPKRSLADVYGIDPAAQGRSMELGRAGAMRSPGTDDVGGLRQEYEDLMKQGRSDEALRVLARHDELVMNDRENVAQRLTGPQNRVRKNLGDMAGDIRKDGQDMVVTGPGGQEARYGPDGRRKDTPGMRSPGTMSKEQRKLARGYGVGYGTRYEQRRPSQEKPAEPKRDLASIYGPDLRDLMPGPNEKEDRATGRPLPPQKSMAAAMGIDPSQQSLGAKPGSVMASPGMPETAEINAIANQLSAADFDPVSLPGGVVIQQTGVRDPIPGNFGDQRGFAVRSEGEVTKSFSNKFDAIREAIRRSRERGGMASPGIIDRARSHMDNNRLVRMPDDEITNLGKLSTERLQELIANPGADPALRALARRVLQRRRSGGAEGGGNPLAAPPSA